MIKYLHLLLIWGCFFWCIPTSSASFGGNLTYKCVGTDSFELSLTVYRNCKETAPSSTQTVTWSGGVCGTGTETLNLLAAYPKDITPNCPTSNSGCTSGFPIGVEEYKYKGIVVVPASCTNIVFAWESCCRNTPTTIANPAATNIAIYASLEKGLAACNNSPIFLNKPVLVGKRNEPVQYNHGATDPDRDSLVYSLVDCRENSSTAVSYISPYSGTNPIGGLAALKIDSITGQLSFTPTVSNQVAVVCILVEEYRGGLKIGEVVRDIQFRVYGASANKPPVLSGVNNTTGYTIQGSVGVPLSFDIHGQDMNTGDSVYMAWDGSINAANWSVVRGATSNQARGNFSWTPQLTDIGRHFFTARIRDNKCPLNAASVYAYSIIIPAPLSPSIDTIITVDVLCNGDSTGEARAVVSGGVPPYAYLWPDGQTTATATGLKAGTYTLTVTDANGASSTRNYTINPGIIIGPPFLWFNDTVFCAGESIIFVGGVFGQERYWTGPNGWMARGATKTIPLAQPIHDGIYSLQVKDISTGCFSPVVSVRMHVNPLPPQPTIVGAGTICFNDTLRLSVNPSCDSLIWQGPDPFLPPTRTTDSVLIVPPYAAQYQSGLWQVTCIDTTTGCSVQSAAEFVNILPSPPRPVLTAPQPVCEGDSVILVAPSVFGATNEWYADSNLTVSLGIGDSLVVSNLLVTDTLFLTQTVNGCTSAKGAVIIKVNPKPLMPLIPPAITACEGDSFRLTTTSLGPNYQWSHALNGVISNQKNPLIFPASSLDSGQYALVVTSTAGCVSDTGFSYVTINSAPTAPATNNNSPVCYGDDIVLTALGACDTLYWISPSGNSHITTNTTLNIDSSSIDYGNGVWRMTCVNTAGCHSFPAQTDTIRIQPEIIFPPVFDNGPVCSGDSVVLIAYPVFNANYTWADITNASSVLATGRQVVFPNIVQDTAFYLKVTVNGCSIMDTVEVATHPMAVAAIPPNELFLCVGDSLQLSTVSAASAYQWINPVGDTSYVAMPMKPSVGIQDSGLYQLSTLDTNGCLTPDTTFTIHVNALPLVPTIIDNNPCNGDTLLLIASGSCHQYRWTSQGGTSLIAGDTLVILPNDPDYRKDWEAVCMDTLTGCESMPRSYHPLIKMLPPQPQIIHAGPICVGDSIALSTAPIAGANYIWRSIPSNTPVGNNHHSITMFTITTDTIVELTVEVNGCQNTDSTEVKVHRQLTAPIVPDSISVCGGDSLLLTTSTVIIGQDYYWQGPASFVSNQKDPIIAPAQMANDGLYTLQIIDTTGCPSLVDTTRVLVHAPSPAPTIYSPNTSFCDGDTLLLIATGTCTQSNWLSPSNTLLSGTDSLLILPPDPNYLGGDWSLVCTNIHGCTSVSNTVTLTIKNNPNLPIISHNSPLCVGDSLELSMALVSAASYQWYAPDTTLLGTQPSIKIGNLQVDTAFYAVVTVNGCSAYDSVHINVQALPAAPLISAVVNPICENDSLRLETSTNAVNYLWVGPNGIQSNAQNPVFGVTVADTGYYKLTVDDTNGCQATDSIWINIQSNPVTPMITTVANVCTGDSLHLEGTGGCSLSRWFSPIGTTLNVFGSGALVVSPDSAEYVSGAWRVICIDTSTGCFSDTSLPQNITIHPLPINISASNDGPVCMGGRVSLMVPQQGAATYIWSRDSLMTDTIGVGHLVLVDSIITDTVFYVEMRSSMGCRAWDSTHVKQLPTVAPNIGAANTMLCEGDSLLLATSTPAQMYYWTGPNTFASNDQFPSIATVDVTNAGIYTLSIVDSNGCTSSDTSISIVVNPTPYGGLTIFSSTNTCDGDSIILETGGTLCDSFAWVGPVQTQGGIMNQTIVQPGDANYVDGAWYLLCYDTTTGCFASSNTVFVTINPVPALPILTNSGPVCSGDSVSLSAAISLGANTNWYTDSLLTNQIGFTRIIDVANITTDTTFYAQQVSGNLCPSPVAKTVVTLHSLQQPIVWQDSIEICEGEDILLGTNSNGMAYNWSGPSYNSILQNPIISNATVGHSGTYVLSMVDSNGCASSTDTTVVVVHSNPLQPALSQLTPTCEGDSLWMVAGGTCHQFEWTSPLRTTLIGGDTLGIAFTDIHYQDGNWEVRCIDTLTGCYSPVDTANITITRAPLRGVISHSGPVCVGDSVEITTTAIAGAVIYQWFSSTTTIGTGQTINILNIQQDSTFYLEVTTTNGCSFVVDSTEINVFSIPTAPPIATNAPICEGDSLVVFSPLLAPTYYWTKPSGGVDSVQYLQIPTASIATDTGVYTLSVVDSNGCVSLDTSIQVTVYPLPSGPTVTGTTTLCFGENLLLNATGTCDSIVWLSPSGLVLGGNNLVLTAQDSAYEGGTWQAFCLDTLTGCQTASLPIIITIRPTSNPMATNNGPICKGDNALLGTNFVIGTSYVWSTDSLLTDTIGTTALVLVNNLSTDSTFYLVTTPLNGCSSSPVATTVQVHPTTAAPIVGPSISACEGEDILLTTTTLATQYYWAGPNGFTANQANPTLQNISMSHMGSYALAVLDSNGCLSDTAFVQVTVDTLPASPSIALLTSICHGDSLFLTADSTANHCDSMAWIAPSGAAYPVLGTSVVVAPSDSNYRTGIWRLRCIDTLTGCFSESNAGMVVIAPLPNTQATYTNGPVCEGGEVVLSTNVVNPSHSYDWYADTALTTLVGIGQQTTIYNITTDTIFYLVVTSAAGCSSTTIPTAVTILPPGPAPAIGGNIEVCEGESIVLTTATLASAYHWSGPNGFVDSVQNPIVTIAATSLDTGLYSLFVVDSNGCASSDTSLMVVVNTIGPAPTISYNGPLCEGDTLVLTSSGACGQSQWIGPNGNSAATLGSPGGGNVLWTFGNTTHIPAGNPNYLAGQWYMVCIDTLTGCQALSDTINVDILAAPSIVNIWNSGPVCINDSIQLNATVLPSQSTINWYTDVALTNLVGTGTSIISPSPSNTAMYYANVLGANGCAAMDSTLVTTFPLSSAPIVPANLTLCEGERIVLTTPTLAAAYEWTGPNGYYSTLQHPPSILATATTSGAYSLTVVDSNGCTSPSSIVQVVVQPVPVAPTLSNNSPVCLGDSVQLTATTIAGATYEWFKLPLNTSAGTGQSISLTNVSYADTGRYYVVVEVNGCYTTSLDTTVVAIFGSGVPAAFAGIDQLLCGTDSTRMTANAISAPTVGTWTSSSTATIVNPNDPTTSVQNLSVGIHVFYWTISNSACNATAVDSVILTVAPIGGDTANAGPDQYDCGITTTTLAANIPSAGTTGLWTQSNAQASAGVDIIDPTNPATGVIGMQAGSRYYFVWELDNGPCAGISRDTMFVDISVVPSDNAFAGVDIITCGRDTIVLNALPSSLGNGLWSSDSLVTIINGTIPDALVTNLLQDTTMLVWTLSNGACANYSSDTMLIIQGGIRPTANADQFNVLAGSTTTLNVLTNDLLTANWDIYIHTATSYGQLINLNNGLFDVILQTTDTRDQHFIYELCNPNCPNSCDTGIVYLSVNPIGNCSPPNIFTPNGDQVNDLFEVPCLERIENAHLLVFNRWGDLVYESDKYNNQWDGTHQGEPLPDGTYFYILKIGEEDEMQGSVEIRR